MPTCSYPKEFVGELIYSATYQIEVSARAMISSIECDDGSAAVGFSSKKDVI